MTPNRRDIVNLTGAALALATVPLPLAAKETAPMYGLIGQMMATPGNRDALVAILAEGTDAMPGCLSYVVANDGENPDAIWITEVWDGKESHAASLKLPAVQAAIGKARPIIAGFGHRFETTPVAGVSRP
ncbi:putative quinol monooxygenase [Phenylobacterium sp. LH3H17]|uniref:putative quinol monooxygenase n=1 Tax=Phenylobacterium sp. LH3H17 TaxID=2903901 RepID=UPI00353062EF